VIAAAARLQRPLGLETPCSCFKVLNTNDCLLVEAYAVHHVLHIFEVAEEQQ
jgi:hypothetical protein